MKLKEINKEEMGEFLTNLITTADSSPWNQDEAFKVRDLLVGHPSFVKQQLTVAKRMMAAGFNPEDFWASWSCFLFQLGREYEVRSVARSMRMANMNSADLAQKPTDPEKQLVSR